MKFTVYDITKVAILSAFLIVVQVVFASLPNIELVTVLIMVYTLCFKKRITIASILVFVILQGLIYGFTIWWVTYLYIWFVLMALTLAVKRYNSNIIYACVGSAFGFLFGLLCSLLYLVIGNVQTAFSFFIAGIPFDIIHGVSNLVTVLVLLPVLQKMFNRINNIKNIKLF